MKLEVTALRCGYTPDKPIISNLSFSLESGDTCCILGRNGVGKSTLFRTMLKLLKPLSGHIHVDGEDISSWSPQRMATVSAYVAQSHNPAFHYLVREMVMLGRSARLGAFGSPGSHDEDVVEKLLEDMDLAHLADKPYTEISGGERQRVMIARALAQESRMILLDEPTAALDYGSKILVLEHLHRLAKEGMCAIFTTHDPEQALLLNASTILLFPDAPAAFGPATQVVTELNLAAAYKSNVRVAEVVDANGHPMRICIPVIRD